MQHDIREADISIRQAYKMYYRFKSSFLENTLSQAIDEDGFDLPLESDQSFPFDSSFSLSYVETPEETSSFLSNFSNLDDVQSSSLINIRNVDENHVIKDFEAEQVDAINENAWGTNLNKKPKKETVKKLQPSNSQSLRQSMTEKLFQMSNFTKRNPRKSLSRSNLLSSGSQSSSFSTSFDTTKETLPDLETILAQKALQEKAKDLTKIPKPSKLNLDKGWLNRCDENQIGGEKTDVTAESPSEPKQFGLSNIITHTYAECTYEKDQSDDEVIENSEDESDVKPRNMRHVLKKRKVFDAHQTKNRINGNLDEKAVENGLVLQDKVHVNEAIEVKVEQVEKRKLTKGRKAKAKKPKPKATTSVTLRRSSRATSSNKINAQHDDSKSETDPFADDSHSDPEFQPDGQSNTLLVSNINEALPATTPAIKKKKSLKNVVKNLAKTITGRRGKKSNKNPDEDQNRSENDVEDMPENYINQIEVEHLRNIPQIDIEQLKEDTALFQEYVDSRAPIKPVIQPKASSPTKRDLEREKLEKKIASGKLNENFVRIDVRKKVFVRGKKTINFSKYKKSKWKKQKAANALAGPEMDMRGCDGGFLVCFNCGQQGHYAQDCKIQCK